MPRKPNPKPPSKPKRKTKAASEGIAPAARVSEEPTTTTPKKRIAYSTELAVRICQEMLERDVEDRTRSLRDVCRLDGMPTETTVYRWLQEHDDFREMYTRTRETLADMNANDILKIADTAEDANLARLRIDARKWWAAKVSPKKYGEKLGISGDGDGGPILTHVIDRPEKETREEWIARRSRELGGLPTLGAAARPTD